jgi:hypothetical protein
VCRSNDDSLSASLESYQFYESVDADEYGYEQHLSDDNDNGGGGDDMSGGYEDLDDSSQSLQSSREFE